MRLTRKSEDFEVNLEGAWSKCRDFSGFYKDCLKAVWSRFMRIVFCTLKKRLKSGATKCERAATEGMFKDFNSIARVSLVSFLPVHRWCAVRWLRISGWAAPLWVVPWPGSSPPWLTWAPGPEIPPPPSSLSSAPAQHATPAGHACIITHARTHTNS